MCEILHRPMEKRNRKANMTYQQSLHLCHRRRPVVDPIPAFRDQLKEYELKCRAWGYLTSADHVHESLNEYERKSVGSNNRGSYPGKEKDTGQERKGSVDDIREKRTNGSDDVGEGEYGIEGRKNTNEDVDHLAKKRKVIRSTIGPAIQTKNPVIGQSVGPVIGPLPQPIRPTVSSSKPAIGPSIGPSTKDTTERAAIGPLKVPAYKCDHQN